MQYKGGTVSFRRFFIEGTFGDDSPEALTEALSRHAFGKGPAAGTDGIETGWIVPDHLFDTDFANSARYRIGEFLHVAMRMDRTAPPPAVLKSYKRMEEQAALAASGREFLSKQERRLAHETAVQRAESEARRGDFRRIAAYSVLIDLERREILFGTQANGAADKLMALVRDTFDVSLTPADAEAVAYRLAAARGRQRAFEDVEPAAFVDRAMAGDAAALHVTDRTHLGWEFLTWIWYRIHRREGLFDLGTDGNVAVSIFKAMRLDCVFDLTGTDSIRNDSPASCPEALAAIAVGKTPRRVSLLLAAPDGEWSFSFDAQKFSISTLTIPALDEADAYALAEHRFLSMRHATTWVERLFDAFLDLRLGESWPKELSGIRHWVATVNATQTRRASA